MNILKFYLVMLSALSLFPREFIIAIVPTLQKNITYYLCSIELSIGIFTFGSGVSQLIVGGIGDFVSKRKLLLYGAFLMIIGNALYYISINSLIFLLTRFIVGIGSGVFTVLIRVILVEQFDKKQSLQLLSWISMSTMIFPLTAPILGVYTTYHYGLDWVFNISILAALLMLLGVFKLPINANTHRLYPLRYYRLLILHNAIECLLDKKMLAPMALSGLVFGCGIGHITASTYILHNHYNISLQDLGWYFAPIAIGYFLGSYSCSKFHHSQNFKIYRKALFMSMYILIFCVLFFNKSVLYFESIALIYFFLSGLYIPYLSQQSMIETKKPAARSSVLGFMRTLSSFLYAIIATNLCSTLFSWLAVLASTVVAIDYILIKNPAQR